jgi:protein-disulfide isomerase
MRVEPEIIAQYVTAGNVRLAFHPVLDLGAASLSASTAAECAGQQQPLGFWSMHDALFERQSDLFGNPDVAWYAEIASSLGLDGATLTACMQSPAAAEKVTRLDQQRRDAGIRQRPSFDVGDRRIEGGLPFAQFQQVLDAQLAGGQ